MLETSDSSWAYGAVHRSETCPPLTICEIGRPDERVRIFLALAGGR